MPSVLWPRDAISDASDVKTTFSSWDQCMTKAYCKWPAIVGIIIGSLIVLSLLFCLFRCLCCGAECCCGCLACCNTCCPSPRRKNRGYEQQPPPPMPGYGYGAYQQPPPIYANGGGYRGAPSTATFDTPGNKNSMGPMGGVYDQRPVNDDALPAMPSWDNAPSRRVEEDDVEMEKLDHQQNQSLLPKNERYYGQPDGGDIGDMQASPYHSYSGYAQQGLPSSYDSRSPPPMNTTTAYSNAPPPASSYYGSPTDTVYQPRQQPWNQQRPYMPSGPPSYKTQPPSMVGSPPPGMQRKPIAGTWRDV